MRVEYHTVADDRQFAAHHAGRQQRQLVAHPVNDKRMAGIVPALKRTTTSARSDSQSTILPLPSSPHCEPTTQQWPSGKLLIPVNFQIVWGGYPRLYNGRFPVMRGKVPPLSVNVRFFWFEKVKHECAAANDDRCARKLEQRKPFTQK